MTRFLPILVAFIFPVAAWSVELNPAKLQRAKEVRTKGAFTPFAAKRVVFNPYNIPRNVTVTNIVITATEAGHVFQTTLQRYTWMTWLRYLEAGESASFPVTANGTQVYQFVPLTRCNNTVPRLYW